MTTFQLAGLNTEVLLTTNVVYPTVPSVTYDYDYNVAGTATAAEFSNVFFFRTTDPELTTITTDDDCNFATYDTIPTLSGVTPSTYTVDGNGTGSGVAGRSFYDSGNSLLLYPSFSDFAFSSFKQFVICLLSYEITGGYNNSDLFSNETALVDQITTLDATVMANLTTVIEAAGTLGAPLTNNDTGSDNVSRDILNHMLGGTAAEIQRVHDAIETAHAEITAGNYIASNSLSAILGADETSSNVNLYDGSGNIDPWIALNFVAGDVIEFLVTYKVDNIQDPTTEIAVDGNSKKLGSNKVYNQTYKMVLTLT
jgi:hypothetical protein